MRAPSFRFAVLLALSLGTASCNSQASSSADPKPPMHGQQFGAEPSGVDPLPQADPREGILATSVAQFLQTQHVRSANINDALSKKSFAEFLERLDPDKLFLLESNVAALRKWEDKLDDELLSGRLELAHTANDMYQARLKVAEAFIKEHLAQAIDFTVEEFRETDAEKIPYAKTDEELSERWRKLLKLEVLGRIHRMELRSESLKKSIDELKAEKNKGATQEEKDAKQKKLEGLERALAKIPTKESERVSKAQSDLQESYSARFARLTDVDPLAPASEFINAITASFDPHTVYLSPPAKENFDISMSNSLEGIGAVLVEEEHYIAVSEVVAGGASWRQGELEAGDTILSVAQEGEEPVDIADMKINRVVKMIRGPKGTTVTLTLEKEDGSIKTISIVRDKVEIQDAFARGATVQRKGGPAIGYIELQSFYGSTRSRTGRFSAEDVSKLLSLYAKRGVKGVILDLRSNGGGLLDDARRMTGFFIKDGPVVQTQQSNGTIEVLRDTDDSILYEGEVVVLIDRFSASASEIVAAALQDYKRAVVVGPGPTHGKGTVQALVDLSGASNMNMGSLKLTVQMFYRINGSSTQRKGVTPDIPFPDSFKHIETGERNLDNALPWSEVKDQRFTAWDRAKWSIDALRGKSEARQAKSAYFTSLEKRADILKERQDDTRIPLKQSDYEARIDAQTKEFEALDPEHKANHVRFTVKPDKYAHVEGEDAKTAQEKLKRWSEGLSKDAVVEESMLILQDMLAAK